MCNLSLVGKVSVGCRGRSNVNFMLSCSLEKELTAELKSLLFKQSTTMICCSSLISLDIKTFSDAAFVSEVEENGHNFVSDIKLVT